MLISMIEELKTSNCPLYEIVFGFIEGIVNKLWTFGQIPWIKTMTNVQKKDHEKVVNPIKESG